MVVVREDCADGGDIREDCEDGETLVIMVREDCVDGWTFHSHPWFCLVFELMH